MLLAKKINQKCLWDKDLESTNEKNILNSLSGLISLQVTFQTTKLWFMCP